MVTFSIVLKGYFFFQGDLHLHVQTHTIDSIDTNPSVDIYPASE